MQEALQRIVPAMADKWWKELERLSNREFHHCAICAGNRGNTAIRIIEKDAGDSDRPTFVDVCDRCAPEYLRKLADVIEETQ